MTKTDTYSEFGWVYLTEVPSEQYLTMLYINDQLPLFAEAREEKESSHMLERPSLPTADNKERFLSNRHQRILELESRISPEVIEARGYWTAETVEELASDPDIKPNQHHAPALVLPIFGVDGEYRYSRIRPDEPPPPPLGKYLQPAGAPNVLDVPRTVLDKVLDSETHQTLVITEGEKKGDSLASMGVAVVCLFGVWNWSLKTGEGTQHETQLLLPDFDHIPLRDRKVTILFDCDTRMNQSIQLAAYRLAHKLKERGARLW